MKALYHLYRDYCVDVENANCRLGSAFQRTLALSETAFDTWWGNLSTSCRDQWLEKFEASYRDSSDREKRRMQLLLADSLAVQDRVAA